MKIAAYTQCPPGQDGPQYLAYLVVPGPKKGSEEFLPVRFGGATEADARAKAQAHWDDAMEKQANAKPRGRQKKAEPATMQDVADEIGDVI